MQQKSDYCNLIKALKSIIGLLDTEEDSSFKKDVIGVCDYLENPSFRIAVFAPFNYGKSTLLNAILGKRTLPIDLIPTTGAAIEICYGEELQCEIVLKNGRKIEEKGIDILKEYAILDQQRCMRNDVAEVKVYCPHSFLKLGVEFIDLPGTDDREAQEVLVRDKLLTSNLIIQVLDARKLMTLSEREQFKDWLFDRGIKTVVFVVNFLNLLEPKEQKSLQYRLISLAESFRTELPAGISNLYRVDALPALRARLKGDINAAQATGLNSFEIALQTIVSHQQDQLYSKLPRLQVIIDKILQIGNGKKQKIIADLEAERQRQQKKIEIQQKASQLLTIGFQQSLLAYQNWLYLPDFLTTYKESMIKAIQQDSFAQWEREELKIKIIEYQKQWQEWLKKGCDLFNHNCIDNLDFSFPDINEFIAAEELSSSQQSNFPQKNIPSEIKWMLKNPLGAVVIGGTNYIIDKATGKIETAIEERKQQSLQIYEKVAEAYLTRFSQDAFSYLQVYEQKFQQIIQFTVNQHDLEPTTAYYYLQLLEGVLDTLNEELVNLIKISEVNKSKQ